jgi:hypothetical protein
VRKADAVSVNSGVVLEERVQWKYELGRTEDGLYTIQLAGTMLVSSSLRGLAQRVAELVHHFSLYPTSTC